MREGPSRFKKHLILKFSFPDQIAYRSVQSQKTVCKKTREITCLERSNGQNTSWINCFTRAFIAHAKMHENNQHALKIGVFSMQNKISANSDKCIFYFCVKSFFMHMKNYLMSIYYSHYEGSQVYFAQIGDQARVLFCATNSNKRRIIFKPKR